MLSDEEFVKFMNPGVKAVEKFQTQLISPVISKILDKMEKQMSGCHPFVPQCKHGVMKHIECNSCEMENDKHSAMKDFDERLEYLETINATLVNKLEKHADIICELQDKVKGLEREIENLKSSVKVHWDDRDYFYRQIALLEEKIPGGFAVKRISREEFKEQYPDVRERKPHSCPVCNGWGKQQISISGETESKMFDCHPCKGKGIIWG